MALKGVKEQKCALVAQVAALVATTEQLRFSKDESETGLTAEAERLKGQLSDAQRAHDESVQQYQDTQVGNATSNMLVHGVYSLTRPSMALYKQRIQAKHIYRSLNGM